MYRRIPNDTYGGVRGRGLGAPSYSIVIFDKANLFVELTGSIAQRHQAAGMNGSLSLRKGQINYK